MIIVEALFEGLTQLDFTGPHTVLHRIPGAETIVASVNGGTVRSDGGLAFAGTTRLEDIPRCDLLMVPGGLAATEAALDRAYIAQLQRLAAGATYLMSVCTGSLILGAAGLLRGKRAACHWAWRHLLPLFEAIPDNGRVCRDGNILTGGGVTAGIDLALVVAAEIAGEQAAQVIQLAIEYAPAPPFSAGRPETAPAEVLAFVEQRNGKLLENRQAQAEEAAARMRDTAR
jgi:transcriptional regulator GlxA family with amidase domain